MTPILALAHRIDSSAHDLAARINAGLYSELNEGERFDLRTLSLAMAEWADEIRTLDAEREGERIAARINRLFGGRVRAVPVGRH